MLPFLLWFHAVTCYSARHKPPLTALVLGNDRFVIRPYRSSDQPDLADMCKYVYGGTDDLALKAQLLQEEPTCEFLVLENETTTDLVATGNLQRMDLSTIFVEAIRVSPSYQGRGIATLWMRELVKLCEDCPEILSCTIDSNEAMKAVFHKCGFEKVSCFQNPDWDRLLKLPGWKATSTTKPQNILLALGLDHKVSDASRNAGIWDTIRTYDELRDILQTNGIGYLPWFEKPMMPSENLRDSLAKGLVRKLRNSNCVFGLVKTDNPNCHLKSDYVCSIVAAKPKDFDAALWEACNEEYVPLLGGIPSFPCVFETFETQGCLQGSLPVQANKVFIHYRCRKDLSK